MERGNEGTKVMTRATALVLGVLSIFPSFPRSVLSAQVGHNPAHSPFHDIRPGSGPALSVGHLGGVGGRAGVGVLGGTTWGAHYDFTLGGPTLITLGASYAETERFIVDPTKGSASRRSGPFDDDVVLFDLGLQIRLAGAKTWHGLAPYVGAALGLAFGSALPSDTSGYDFGTKFTIAPGAGVRWHPGRRISVQADARALFWKLRYPLSFKNPSPVDGTRVLPLDDTQSEWTRHPWVTLGAGWIF